ncbi:MAG: molybdopterin molybdotransferase MoeA [Dehalococcoidia bacterium]|nr:molybdopterin molybdotransferase MoeA [Dehalococcoidia bacterium]
MADQNNLNFDEQTYSSTKTGDRSILPVDMISVEEARTQILNSVSLLPAEMTKLSDALGLTLAEDLYSTFDIPPLPNTGMDGYAVRSEDTEGATYDKPIQLKVIGYLAAGFVYEGLVGKGEAVRIMTGAPIPKGANSIVPFEETDEYDWATRDTTRSDGEWETNPKTEVRIDVHSQTGANIRKAGEDITANSLALRQGALMGPAEIGVAASLGLAEICCYRRPKVAILSTGDELLPPGQALSPGKIYDANSFSLAAQVISFGGIPRVLDISADTIEDLTKNIQDGVSDADLLITSAGVSRGDFDVVKTVLANQGEIGFWTVRMKPGKPLAFGTLRDESGREVPHLGLPGNPVSAMMTFELFGRPALFKMLGRLHNNPEAWMRRTIMATAHDRLKNTDGRRFYARCKIELTENGYVARLTGAQGSGVLTSMMLADGYAICPEDTRAIEVGELVEVMLVD